MILHRRGRQPSREGAPTYDFSKFSEKLCEIEKILTVGLTRRERPLLISATVHSKVEARDQ